MIAPIAGEFAEQVLHIYEAYNPDSSALKRAIRCAKGNYAAYAAAHVAYCANTAANAAAYAAAYAAYAAYYANAAAYYANTAAYAARATTNAVWAARAADAAVNQESIQINIMKKHLKTEAVS